MNQMKMFFTVGIVLLKVTIKLYSYEHALASPQTYNINEQSWGESVEGFRLALGFSKSVYGTNEPVNGMAFLWNESDVDREIVTRSDEGGTYAVTILDDGRRLVPMQDTAARSFIDAHSTTIRAHSQLPSVVIISHRFTLVSLGTYSVSISGEFPSTNRTGKIRLSSGTALIRIADVDRTGTNGEVTAVPWIKQSKPAANAVLENRRAVALKNIDSSSSSPLRNSDSKLEQHELMTPQSSLPVTAQVSVVETKTRVALAIISAFLALLALILWRAKARQKRSSS